MRGRAAVLAGLALGLAAAPPALAADAQGQFAAKGVGQARCLDLNDAAAARSPQLGPMLSWIAGYLSAANRYEPDTFDLLSWQDETYVYNSIRAYCARNPQTPLTQMARAMVKSLGPGRVRTATPTQVVNVGGRQVALYGSVVAAAKRRLAEQGLYRGPVDMTPDGRFIAAITAFQQKNRLPVTGVPDQATLFRLLGR